MTVQEALEEQKRVIKMLKDATAPKPPLEPIAPFLGKKIHSDPSNRF